IDCQTILLFDENSRTSSPAPFMSFMSRRKPSLKLSPGRSSISPPRRTNLKTGGPPVGYLIQPISRDSKSKIASKSLVISTGLFLHRPTSFCTGSTRINTPSLAFHFSPPRCRGPQLCEVPLHGRLLLAAKRMPEFSRAQFGIAPVDRLGRDLGL